MDTFSAAQMYFFLFLTISTVVLAQPSLRPVLLGQPVVELPRPYQFGYSFGDGLGMNQHRQESSDGTGSVTGSYGYQEPLGVYRRVQYTAGADGYKAQVFSNEPGLTSHVAADAPYDVQPPPEAAVAQGLIRMVPVLQQSRK